MFYTHHSALSPSLPQTAFSSPTPPQKNLIFHSTRKGRTAIATFKIGPQEILELAHNKVLVASALSCVIGQISKPFTAAINGNGIDLKAAIRSGGMPSTHSASVAAAATTLGLERGFSDSIFGMCVVFAALVMYDAQGVRREVGYHAKILNKLQMSPELESRSGASSINSKEVTSLSSASENRESYTRKSQPYRLSNSTSKLEMLPTSEVDIKEPLEKSYSSYRLLNESVGHNEIQVLVGILLGFIVSLAVDTVL